MAKRANEKRSPPESRASGEAGPGTYEAELKKLCAEGRDAYGRYTPGTSGNPGGIRREVLEARRAFTYWLPDAVKRNAALMASSDIISASIAVGRVFERALGKASAPAELPVDDVLPEETDTSPRALLDRALRLKARTLALAERQLQDGTPLSDAQRTALNEDIASLGSLLKAEKEAAASGTEANLSDDDLVAKVLASLPAERLADELQKRGTHYPAEPKA